jgi:hypothetical protein
MASTTAGMSENLFTAEHHIDFLWRHKGPIFPQFSLIDLSLSSHSPFDCPQNATPRQVGHPWQYASHMNRLSLLVTARHGRRESGIHQGP